MNKKVLLKKLLNQRSLIISSLLLIALFLLNSYFEIIAFHPLFITSKHDISVITWNIHCPEGTNEERQKQIANILLEIDADLVSLNEYLSDSCSVLDSMLRTRYEYYDLSASHTICGNALYSKLPLYDSGMIDTEVFMKPMSNIAATINISGDSVFIIGIHLPSNNDGDSSLSSLDRYKAQQKNRNWSISFVKKWVLEHNHPAIVMGDFNDFSFSAPCDSLKDIGMIDSWWEGGFGYGTTFHDGWMRLRIDHIFHSQELKLCGVEMIDTDLSDHNPMVAKFKVGKK